MGEDYMIYSYSGILFSYKKEEILSHAIACTQLEDIMLNEIGRRIPYDSLILSMSSSQIHQSKK